MGNVENCMPDAEGEEEEEGSKREGGPAEHGTHNSAKSTTLSWLASRDLKYAAVSPVDNRSPISRIKLPSSLQHSNAT